MVDPVDIVNEFFTRNPGDPNWPAMTIFDDYWGKKICALAERLALAENELERLKNNGSALAYLPSDKYCVARQSFNRKLNDGI